MREQYKVKLEEEVEKLRSPVRPPSTTASVLSSEAAEFVPSSFSNSQSNYYNYYQHQGYFQTFYPGYEPDYCYDQVNVTYSRHMQPPQTGIEANIWSNMLDILKTS